MNKINRVVIGCFVLMVRLFREFYKRLLVHYNFAYRLWIPKKGFYLVFYDPWMLTIPRLPF